MSQDPALVPLALEIHDALAVVAARGWSRVTLALAPRPDGAPRVASLTTELAPNGGAAKPDLGVEEGAMSGAMNEAIADLARALAAAGVAWDRCGLRAERRGAAGAALVLLRADGSAAHEILLPPAALTQLLFTEALFTAAERAAPEAIARQDALAADIAGHDDWTYDQSTGELTLARGVLPWRVFRAEVLGSYAEESETWLWGWANKSVSPARTRGVAALRDAARGEPGLSAFLRPSIPCEARFGGALAQLAAARMNARGVYPANYGGGTIFLAVF